MRVTLTDAARSVLAALANERRQALRINGELVGGCGMTVEYGLFWDEPMSGDRVLEEEGMTLLVDKETETYVGAEELVIDYREQQGFRLVTPQEILAYGLQVKERWS
ncbi:iron-sulfur cluster biosynthesis family protein [Brevibacillus thermoruber]|jgi:Fe-S cluster assembly iron-binding protein IscA|uniref:iron-sulfur cluster biosynthesis family protein n=1 Tax=Brevibacillus thermoruber TaxID=33942 RepID=UPI000405413B|nr:iron-sulfur cluster biosynthesis family protein [Brevibacillus thermoruber]